MEPGNESRGQERVPGPEPGLPLPGNAAAVVPGPGGAEAGGRAGRSGKTGEPGRGTREPGGGEAEEEAAGDEVHDGRAQPVDGGVPGPRSPAAAGRWGATYGQGAESGTDYEATRQSTEAIRAAHRVARGPGNPRAQARSAGSPSPGEGRDDTP